MNLKKIVIFLFTVMSSYFLCSSGSVFANDDAKIELMSSSADNEKKEENDDFDFKLKTDDNKENESKSDS